MRDKLDTILGTKMDEIAKKTDAYIVEVERNKKEAQNRFVGFTKRKKLTDYLVQANLILTPIILIVVLYMLFK